VPNIAEKLKEAQASSYMVVIDLRELEFIDYAWLGTLIAADARARQAKKSLVVVRGKGQVDRMLEQSGLLEQLEVIDLQPRTASPPEHDDDHPTRAHSATQAAPSEPTGKRAPASLLVSTSPLHHRDKAVTPTRSTGFGQPME
jgi:anti-anti-sigma factor